MRALLLILLALTAALLARPPMAAADVVWLCKPGLADDPCTLPFDTTVREVGAADRIELPTPGRRDVDCFYVYPTVSNQPTPNATKARDPEVVSIAKYQAARFSLGCRVFAPIYRQATLGSITGSAGGAPDRELGYADVVEAWREYLAEDNRGRGVVLIGHSQGTGVLRRLLRQEIEPSGQARRIVSALLIGGNVTVPAGRVVGGDFRRTPLCTQPVQVRCVVAFSTFAEDPPPNARFGVSRTPPAENPSGLPGGPGFEVACTDPRPLARVRGPLRGLAPSEPYAPGPIAGGIAITFGGAAPTAGTTWVVPPDRFEGGCRTINGANVLRYDPLPGSRKPGSFPDPTWGTHLVDVNLALDPLVGLVGQQGARWARPQVRLARRCAGSGVRVSIGGRERSFVRSVAFRLGGRVVARDASAPFARTLSRRTLRRADARRVRAVVRLRAGEARRLVRQRSLPAC